MREAGFEIIENPNEPENGSRVYTNPWIAKNRFENKVSLHQKINDRLEPMPYPVTNMVLVGERKGIYS